MTTWPNKSFAALDATAAASLTLAMLAAIPAHAIPALRNELLAGLTAQQFSVLRPDQLRALSPDQVRVLTARHFSALSAEQLSSLSAEQLQASSTAQKFSSWCQEHRGGNAPAVTAQVRATRVSSLHAHSSVVVPHVSDNVIGHECFKLRALS